MNLPNLLTISRIVLSPVYMVLFLIENPYSRLAATLVFIIAALTDIFDGYFARRMGSMTGFGKFMDPLADKILVSTAFISFVNLGYARGWMVTVIIIREFIITGLRSVAAYKGMVITPSFAAQWKTATQMIVISCILVYINMKTLLVPVGYNWSMFNSSMTNTFFDIMIFITLVLTVATGVDYLLKSGGLLKGVLK
ncbi:MAG: CDP-diacylglycerol--glycerol-3-phosphate 3-phosphatidyltransferase [candidate division Zixibacteria bacterium 4484_95]|nr:MAG: CDP-diacylglycerol--glycerol-3-phosphate 3-phosphatidyltransferase [candidate division Zixibacteria bacterium 4484_95]RKX17194.1 MAG: CDP-diacylglycerol--glycerol-3-phosphate 3-phosphatidyltransferase [candidate division Zixibacteria bacterium]